MTVVSIKSIVTTLGEANIFLQQRFLLSQLMLTLEKTQYLSVSQTYGLCLALLNRSIWAGIFYSTVMPPSTFTEQIQRKHSARLNSRLR